MSQKWLQHSCVSILQINHVIIITEWQVQPRSPVKSLYQPITGQRFLKVEHHQYHPPSHFRLRLPRHHLPTGLRNLRMQFYGRKPEKLLRPQIAIFQTQISVILHSAKYCPSASWSETAILLRGSTFQIQNLLILIYLIYILTNADSLIWHWVM